MNTTATKYWKIECTSHMKTLFKTKIEVTRLSEEKLKELMTILICKYALSDEEIVEQCSQKTTYVNIHRSSSSSDQSLSISFMAQSADISVNARLTD